MIGLEYILKLYNVPYTKLAEELKIKRQNITCWLNQKQDISKKHLPALSEKFGIPEDYFQRELTELDKLDVQIYKVNKEIDDSSFFYDDEIYDSNTGETISVKRKHYDKNAAEYLESLEVDKKELQLIAKLKTSINTVNGGFNITAETDLHSFVDGQKRNIKLYDRLIDIVDCVNIDNYLLHQIMRATELLDERLSDKNIIWGKENPMDISSVSDESTIVQELFIVLNKYVTQEKQKREKDINKTKKLMKDLGLTKKDLI